ncbi:unnamed protein product [Oikopleura dioica]|uniref:EXS domain-containing protein n=1 Tax=Oikopleura dioica TaxID=34765 RepID=E4YZA7_OIKDI|nr:unnamed protein product [Oikopleura dioica]
MHKKKEQKRLKEAICEFYLFVKKLQAFQELNFTAFRKINKKHDKIMNSQEGAIRMSQIVNSRFNIRSLTLNILRELESLMSHLESGDSKKAMNRLRVPPITDIVEGKTNHYLLIFGALFGTCLMFLLASIGLFFLKNATFDVESLSKTIVLFRPTLLVALFIIFFALNMYGWARAGVNNVLIFEIDPRDRLTAIQMGCVGAGLLLIWLVCLWSFFLLSSNLVALSFRPFVNYIPITLDLLFLLVAVFPSKGSALWTTQKFFWKLLIRELKAGFIPVAFVDFWFADQLNSLAQVFLDFEQTLCLIATNKINLSFVPDPIELNKIESCTSSSVDYGFRFVFWILPAYIRFAQCIRRAIDSPKRRAHHLQNAAKYSTSFLKVALAYAYAYSGKDSTAFAFWIVANIIASLFTLVWDLKVDWGLFNLKKVLKTILRDELIYGHGETNWLYYAAILQDIFLRFAWLAKYFIGANTDSQLAQIWQTVFAFLELVRRFIWNFFRLENEHLNNVGEFRAVREISLIVINEDEIVTLESLMDMKEHPELHKLKAH